MDLQILRIIHQSSIWNRFRAGRISNADERFDEARHFVVVPVRERQYELFVDFLSIRVLRIMNNERTT